MLRNMPLWLLYIMLLSLMTSARTSFIDLYPASVRKASIKRSIDNPDLVNMIHSRPGQHDGVFSNAVQLLESMKSSPSCSRIAAMKLLTSCQGLSNSENHGGSEIAKTLDRVKSIYAARLALCELSGAGASIPKSCSSIQITSDKRYNESSVDIFDSADDFSTTVIEGCLSGLESRPQWWTSYSNSRQNAIVICQAARFEIEREELLNLHQSLTKNTANLNSALRDATAENFQHKAFVETVRELRNQLTTELHKDSSRLKSLFTGLFQDFEGIVGTSITKVLSLLRDVETNSTALSRGMQLSVADVAHLRDQINEIYADMERRNSELRDLQTKDMKDMESNHQLALFVQSSLNNLQDRVAGVDGALEWLVERFATIHQQERLILERLHAFETHLNKSEIQAKELLETQAMHAKAIETQAQAQEALGASAKVAFAILEKLTTRAANLESILEETAGRFSQFQNLDRLVGIKTAFSFVVAFMAVQNPKLAVLMIAFAGLALVAKAIAHITAFNFPAFF